jgi:large subunit ribosomal protein L16
MLFIPLKSKYKKFQKGKSFLKLRFNDSHLKFGQLGLRALSSCRITSKQLVTLYNFLRKKMKKKGKVIFNIFPNISVTKKPLEVRMGKGKGSFSFWCARVFAGSIFCEISTRHIYLAVKVLNNARFKLPLKSKIYYRKN